MIVGNPTFFVIPDTPTERNYSLRIIYFLPKSVYCANMAINGVIRWYRINMFFKSVIVGEKPSVY